MAEVVDLLDSDEEELGLPLAARLGKREGPSRPQASQDRAPLAAVHNQQQDSGSGGGGGGGGAATLAGRPNSPTSRPGLAATASLGGADLLRQRQAERAARKAARAAAAGGVGGGVPGLVSPLNVAAADPDPRPQYHQQEQRQEGQQYGATLGGGSQPAARRGPTRGVGSGSTLHNPQAAPWQPPFDSQDASLDPYSQPDAADDGWKLPRSSQGAGPCGGAAAAAAAAVGAGQPPAKKGGRRPKRTAEEIARDKAMQVGCCWASWWLLGGSAARSAFYSRPQQWASLVMQGFE